VLDRLDTLEGIQAEVATQVLAFTALAERRNAQRSDGGSAQRSDSGSDAGEGLGSVDGRASNADARAGQRLASLMEAVGTLNASMKEQRKQVTVC
jgi:hypothetical protein